VHDIASNSPTPLRFALVAETLADAREVMIDGISGIWRIARRNRPEFEITRRRLVWPNGSVAQLFSSEDPDSLRGPQFDHAWCDELAKWKHGQETWDMLQFGLRLGTHPRQMVTTTPRPVPLIRALIEDPSTVLTRIATRANATNLAAGFLEAIDRRYGGTRLGRQELDGELVADREDALWNRAMLERLRIRHPGPLGRIVVGVDPPAAEKASGSCCGIVVAGLDATGRGVVLADLSVENASPAAWGNAVVRAFRRFQADRVVAEVNQGGDMVAAILRSIDQTLPVTNVRATRGKFLRAEPVAALYEQGRVVHAGTFAALEDQMSDFVKSTLTICYSSVSVSEFCKVLQISSARAFLYCSRAASPLTFWSENREYRAIIASDRPTMSCICVTDSPMRRKRTTAVQRRPCSVTPASSGILSRSTLKCFEKSLRV
jgi:phage terminase large subunit-like protein